MKKIYFVLIFFLLGMVLFAEKGIEPTFSFGSIGATFFAQNSGDFDIAFTATVLDIHLFHPKSRLGFDFSPFYFKIFTDKSWQIELVNATLFHNTFSLGKHSGIGPFAGIHWLDFNENIPTLTAGLRIRYLEELRTTADGSGIMYISPLLFNYVNLDIGLAYRKDFFAFTLAFKTDLSLLPPLAFLVLAGIMGGEREKVPPPYDDL